MKITDNESFKKHLKTAIESGMGVDYCFDGEGEVPIDTFDADKCLEEVIDVINKFIPSESTQTLSKDEHSGGCVGEREIFFYFYECPNCKSEGVREDDKYCSECGCKLEWKE